VIIEITDFAIKGLYSELKPHVFYQEESQEWHLKTALFRADKPFSNNTHSPNLNITSPTILIIGSIFGITLGFPLFWLLILMGSSHKRKHIFKGSAILLTVVCLNAVLMAVYKIMSYLQGSALIRLYSEPYIQHPPSTPNWLFYAIKPLLDTMGYVSVLVAPVLLAYLFCYRGKYEDAAINESNDAPKEISREEQWKLIEKS